MKIINTAQTIMVNIFFAKYKTLLDAQINELNNSINQPKTIYITYTFQNGGFAIDCIDLANYNIMLLDILNYLECMIRDYIEIKIKYHNYCSEVKYKNLNKCIIDIFEQPLDEYINITIEPVV